MAKVTNSNFFLKYTSIVVFVGIALAFSATNIGNYDIWWHLNLGRSILNTGTISIIDTFTYTHYGLPQYNGEWLGDLIFFLVYNLGGIFGLLLLKAVFVLGIFYFIYRALLVGSDKQDVNWLYASLTTMGVIFFAIKFRLLMRPFLFSYLFVSFFMFIILHWHQYKNKKYLLMLLPVQLIWANSSKGAFLGPLLVVIYLFSELVSLLIERRLPVVYKQWLQSDVTAEKNFSGLIKPDGFKFMAGFSFLLFVVSIAQPELWYIYKYFLYGILFGGDVVVSVGEQMPLSISLLWGYGLRYTLGLQIVFILALLGLFLRRSHLNVFYILLFIVFFFQVILMIRMASFFSIVMAPVVVPVVYFIIQKIDSHPRMSRIRPGFLVFILVVVVTGNSLTKWSDLGLGLNRKNIPTGSLNFVEQNNISGPVFNSYPFGGFLAWKRPESRVYIDGRINQLFDSEFYSNYYKIMHNSSDWVKAEKKWGFNYAIFEYDLKSGATHFPRHINENRDWALVYWDDISMVYLKRIPQYEKIINRYEYRIFKPSLNQFDYLQSNLALSETQLLSEIEREINLNPRLQEPRLAKTFLLFNLNRFKYQNEIYRELVICRELYPDLAMEHSALATMMLLKNMKKEAWQEIEQALRLDPNDKNAQGLKQRLQNEM